MDIPGFVLLCLLAVAPPLLFLEILRRTENFQRERITQMLPAFVVGGTLGVLLGIVLSVLFETSLFLLQPALAATGAFFGVVFVAPLAEELAKALGLGSQKQKLIEPEDGVLYGAAIGLGFAATENILYGFQALTAEGQSAAIATLLVRAISSTLLHAVASAFVGYAYGVACMHRETPLRVIPSYLFAVLLHGAFNALVVTNTYLGFLVAAFIVWFLASYLRRQVAEMDRLPHDRFA